MRSVAGRTALTHRPHPRHRAWNKLDAWVQAPQPKGTPWRRNHGKEYKKKYVKDDTLIGGRAAKIMWLVGSCEDDAEAQLRYDELYSSLPVVSAHVQVCMGQADAAVEVSVVLVCGVVSVVLAANKGSGNCELAPDACLCLTLCIAVQCATYLLQVKDANDKLKLRDVVVDGRVVRCEPDTRLVNDLLRDIMDNTRELLGLTPEPLVKVREWQELAMNLQCLMTTAEPVKVCSE